MARKQPTAPAFEGFGFFFPRAALNLGIEVNRADDYEPRLDSILAGLCRRQHEGGQTAGGKPAQVLNSCSRTATAPTRSIRHDCRFAAD